MEDILSRTWVHLVGRLDGPLHFRFIVQPVVAVLIAARAGLRDAHAGRPPFLAALFWRRESRHGLWQETKKDIWKLFLVATLLDVVYQLRVHAAVFAGELLVTAVALSFVPYALVRGSVTRVARRRSPPKRPLHA
jgi:hypothetical protein